MTYDEFIARAEEIGGRYDSDLHKQLRQLYVDRGTLQQVVAMILARQKNLTEALAATHMLTDVDIRTAIGIQGQVSGIKVVLSDIFDLMQAPPEDENADTKS